MPIHVALTHRTTYKYDRPTVHGPHIVRLRPAPHCRTPIISYSLKVEGGQHFLNWQQDPFSNYLARLNFEKPLTELTIEVDLVAELAVFNPFDFFLEEYAEEFPFSYEPATAKELGPFLEKNTSGLAFAKFNDSINRTKRRTIEYLVDLNASLANDIQYGIRLEPGVQTPEQTLTLQSGSCRDTALLMVQLLRHQGLAARFVSGYLIQLTPDIKSLDGPSGTEVDFTDLHAWVEVYLPGAGWVGLDPTSGLFAGEGHIPLACTPDPSAAAPISGAIGICETEFSHHMEISRVVESPRVTKPYTEAQWADIEALGHQIDRELVAGDVRLTMGGEPTFISIDDMEGEEWNFTAVGPHKRELCGTLLRRLKARFAPDGLLHHGQGKWYPGESLPRWSYGCWWRRDGQPLWHDDSLLADINKDYGHTADDAQRFITALTGTLGITAEHILPGYEDVWYYLWRERRLPGNVDVLDSKLDDKEERDRLAKIYTNGLDNIVGYVMPLRREKNGTWVTGSWFLRREHLFLIPGDSAMGLRLPLDSIPWVSDEEHPRLHDVDPTIPQDPFAPFVPPLERLAAGRNFHPGILTVSGEPDPSDVRDANAATPAELPKLSPRQQVLQEAAAAVARPEPYPVKELAAQPDHEAAEPDPNREPGPGESAPWISRTALCVECREGKLFVFIPPVRTTSDYLDLISALEATAAQLKLPIVLEGTPPPYDQRLQNLKVTPDPGVIEVNMQPAFSWDELVHNTTIVYEEARLTRLGTEKFMIDGRHVGTGGGNHLVIGGNTPADSPLLRRPDLLRSLINFWQNHPSLSFLFSGLFIGPTSQHPRIDEARNDSLYELELAFRQIPESGPVPPWLVDRIFRNLLIDVAGNTHRAEFCIDKLYSPDSVTGRLGLLELRAFEMPPHARMSLAQQLVLRALIARFWKTPYNEELVRWGTSLHDRFMLPHFVEQDFHDVLRDLRDHGYQIHDEWFAPHVEFRFPICGSITHRGVHVEIRQALEPWHVLGEQNSAGSTTRYVDSSVERLQVKVTGLTDPRHRITCNGHTVPLHPTGTAGEYVAAVRFRAWAPPEALHPTIPVQAPLTFDLVDSWNERSLGGCQYHVSHPGGLSYATLPVNSYEAEARRLSRFLPLGHTPGKLKPLPPAVSREHPLTLDLRLTAVPPRG
ncbi:MAG: transglutaminase family protein [Verrucomicrobiota bacterium]